MTAAGDPAKKITDVAVIIVNYNTAALALQAVGTVISKAHGARRVHVHLVDNASPGGDAVLLAKEISDRGWEDRVTLYPETENHGFGRGNNVVLEHLRGLSQPPQAVFFLNPDALLQNEAIEALAQFLDQNPGVAMAGARIEKPDHQAVTAAFRFPNLVYTFSSALCFGPISRGLARWNVPLPPDTPTQQVDWVSGAAFLARFDWLERVGFFDPAFFLYFEEVDLMHQTCRAGGEIWHVAQARVVHAEGAATGVGSGARQRKRRPAYWYQSWYHYLTKNHGRAYTLLAMVLWMSGAVLNTVLYRLRGKTPAAPLHLHADLWAVAGRPLIGLSPKSYE